ncbi:hypothetical protein CC85DRAFT_284296 [Cutaneotrichosporon oleaginosum]|uniref:Uncharacterized protein n=1 Tax=Cutaneotrichosporon oleaginosum TaxID=879819 RepID=A0A0J0XR39_9TREE|nr:uncharacterized protein CC85DRAFT_284296 [Cutaneotrichosporon oleaginosum]KLT43586.1 hypothetical protein CC85DRAFT_284296 [Cutaneotrichosporon oleaginosum]TXT12745.1 hypothetical protein COLE_03155 [Cutaneotrichosporon oleaginosum]
MRFSIIAFAAIVSTVASARSITPVRRDDIDEYTFPQECSTQCANVIQFRDACRAKNIEIDDDRDRWQGECHECQLIAVQGAADCASCLQGLQNRTDDTDDVVEDMLDAQRKCANVTQSGVSNQVSQTAQVSQSASAGGQHASGASSAAAPVGSTPAPAASSNTNGASAVGLSGAAVAVAIMAAAVL